MSKRLRPLPVFTFRGVPRKWVDVLWQVEVEQARRNRWRNPVTRMWEPAP